MTATTLDLDYPQTGERPRLATCSYKQFRPEMGVPVKTSTGHPRWRLPYTLIEKLPAIAPFDIFGKPGMTDIANYEPAYLARLDAAGAADIGAALTDISRRHPGETLVMLCFEPYANGEPIKPGDWCHRRMFAAWFERHTGLVIPELGGT